MSDGSAAEYAVQCDAPAVEMERSTVETLTRWKSLPWARIIIDTLLVAGILLASSNLLSVR